MATQRPFLACVVAIFTLAPSPFHWLLGLPLRLRALGFDGWPRLPSQGEIYLLKCVCFYDKEKNCLIRLTRDVTSGCPWYRDHVWGRHGCFCKFHSNLKYTAKFHASPSIVSLICQIHAAFLSPEIVLSHLNFSFLSLTLVLSHGLITRHSKPVHSSPLVRRPFLF